MTKREDQAREYAAEQWRYVKVYGADGDRLRLTAAEREALAIAVEYVGSAFQVEHHAATLQRLLERTG